MTAIAPAYAHEATLGVDQTIMYQSNAFNSSFDPVSDGLYKVEPRLTLTGDVPKLAYRIEYEPSIKVYFQTPGISGVDHYANGAGRYRLTAKDSVTARLNIADWRAIRSSTVNDPTTGAPQNVQDDTGKVLRIYASLSHQHLFSPRSALRTTADYQDYGYTDSFNTDNRSLSGSMEYTYMFSPRFGLGGNFVGLYRKFDDRFRFIDISDTYPIAADVYLWPGSTTGIINANLVIFSDLTKTFRFRVSGGPSGVVLRQSSLALDTSALPVLGLRVEELRREEITYFASASLIKTLSRGKINLDWVRNEDASSGVGTSTLLNQVSLSAWWDTDQYWRVRGMFGWRNRQQESEPVSGVVNLEREFTEVWFDTSAIRRLTENLDISFRFRYVRRLDDIVGTTIRPESENFTGAVTIRYEFEPYRF